MSQRQRHRLHGKPVEYGQLPPATCTRKPKPAEQHERSGETNILGQGSDASVRGHVAAFQGEVVGRDSTTDKTTTQGEKVSATYDYQNQSHVDQSESSVPVV